MPRSGAWIFVDGLALGAGSVVCVTGRSWSFRRRINIKRQFANEPGETNARVALDSDLWARFRLAETVIESHAVLVNDLPGSLPAVPSLACEREKAYVM